MPSENVSSCSMFGGFNLRDGNDLASFKSAYDAFCLHLKDQGYVTSWRVWKRAYHDGYDSNFPDVAVMIEMAFPDHAASLACWDYVESQSEPMHSLHLATNIQVKDTFFTLMQELV